MNTNMKYYRHPPDREWKLERIDDNTFQLVIPDTDLFNYGDIQEQLLTTMIFASNRLGYQGYFVEGISTRDGFWEHNLVYRFHVRPIHPTPPLSTCLDRPRHETASTEE